MKRINSSVVRECSGRVGHTGASIIGLAVVWVAAAPVAWGQWAACGTGQCITSGSVGIGIPNPDSPLSVTGSSSFATGRGQLLVQDSASAMAFRMGTGTDGTNKVVWAQATESGVSNNRNLALQPYGGAVGVGTTNPTAQLQIGVPTNLTGAMSTAFAIYSGTLGSTAGSAIKVASLGFNTGNVVALGVRGYRTANGGDYSTAVVGLGMDVDNTTGSGGLWMNLGGQVGIGTATPSAGVRLQLGDYQEQNVLNITGANPTNMAPIVALYRNGTSGATWNQAIDTSGNFTISNTNGFTDAALSGSAKVTIQPSGNVGIGATPTTSKLAVGGTIEATELVVTSAPSDYVFDPGYRLAPLTEVAHYIEENHHLPDIPPGPEVAKNGIGVGDMQSKLLAKVEELTLHMIRMDAEIQELKKRNAKLASSSFRVAVKDSKTHQ